MAKTASTMLPLGTVAPDFRLPDPTGEFVSLTNFADQPALHGVGLQENQAALHGGNPGE